MSINDHMPWTRINLFLPTFYWQMHYYCILIIIIIVISVNRSVTGAPAGVRGLQIWEWEVKRGLRNRTLLSKLANGSDLDIELGTSVKSVLYKRAIWEKHVEWQMDGDSNESVYARCARGAYVNWVKGVAEWVKKNPLRWFGYNERMQTRVCEKKKCIGAKPKVQTGGVSHLEDKKIR